MRSQLHADELAIYRCSSADGLVHDMVNDQQNFVNPIRGTQTQGGHVQMLIPPKKSGLVGTAF